MHSISYCLPNLRASQCITQFAALFIVVRSDRSIAGNLIHSTPLSRHSCTLSNPSSAEHAIKQSVPPLTSSVSVILSSEFVVDISNDPSAGSPTETLLRLLLPLSDKVHEVSS